MSNGSETNCSKAMNISPQMSVMLPLPPSARGRKAESERPSPSIVVDENVKDGKRSLFAESSAFVAKVTRVLAKRRD